MDYETIQVTLAEDVATLRLNRPDKMNAMNAVMRRELVAAISEAAANARAIVLTGNGPGFCAGQDLGDVKSFDELDLGAVLRDEYEPLIRTIHDCPVPVIAAINGSAAGAGANIALSADIIIAARSASFLEAFARIGLIPDAGGTYWLPRLVGHARAMGMSLLADKIPAEKALEWGLIWEVVDDDTLDTRAHEIAQRLAKGPTKAYGLIKKALHASQGNDLAAQMEMEATLQADAGQSRDFKEGVMAFLEKRPARYTGN